MPSILDRIDSAPVAFDDFSQDMKSWVTILVDTLNEIFRQIESDLNVNDNGLILPRYTTAQITILSASALDGTMWYDTDTNEIKAKINGVVVVVA